MTDSDRDSDSERNIYRSRSSIARSSIVKNNRKMINNPDYSDVVFICKDGAPVHGCSYLLAAQNDFFRGMFLGGMRDPRHPDGRPKISLPEISSTALLSVIETLYTGGPGILKFDELLSIEDWRSACDTMVAAKFFLIKELADRTWCALRLSAHDYKASDKCFKPSSSHYRAEDDIQAIIKTFSIVAEYDLDKVFNCISRFLSEILVFTPLKPEHLRALSRNALLRFLEVTKTPFLEWAEKDLHVLTRTEFGRFRTVVLWCACKDFTSEEIAYMVKLLGKQPEKQKRITCEQQDMYSNVKGQLAQAVEEYLPRINFQHLAPDDLVNIVAPMEIVPGSDIEAALQFQKLQIPFEVEINSLGWSVNRIHKVSEDGCQIQQHEPGTGFSYYKHCANSRVGGIYQWEITIEEVCDPFIEVGLHFSPDENDLFHGFMYLGDDYEPYIQRSGVRLDQNLSDPFNDGYALRMDSTGMSSHRQTYNDIYTSYVSGGKYGKDCSQLVYGRDYADKHSKIKICLDISKLECSFSVDNKDFGVAWTEQRFLSGVYYPAVSLGNRPSGAVSIRVLKVGEWDFASKSGLENSDLDCE